MKKNILFLVITIWSNTLFAQTSQDILGIWLNEEEDAKIEVFIEDGKIFGKIVWLLNPKDENGDWRLDEKNPNENLRSRKILGLTVMHNLKWDEDNKEWNSGKIYDAREGDTYSLYARLDRENILKLKGYIGFSLFGKTTSWTRSEL